MSHFILALSILISLSASGSCVTLEQDLVITWEQKLALDKLREMVVSIVPHEYMKEDIYLIRWLRARNFNVERAKEMLLKNIKWRQENRMDTILQEDFSDFEEDFKYFIKAHSYDGKPVAYFDVGTYDLRALLVKGLAERGSRYMERYLEDVTSQVRDLRAEGKNITQYDFLLNLEGQNIIQHACLQCISMYVRFINTYESYFTGQADKMLFINANAGFVTLLNSLRPVMSPQTQQALEVYGTNKKQWQKRVFELIPREQLPVEVGGEAYYGDLF